MSATGGLVVKHPGQPVRWIPLADDSQTVPQLFNTHGRITIFVAGEGLHEWRDGRMQQILEHDELSPAQSITITAGQVSSGDSSTQLIGTSDGRLFRLEDDTLTHVVWPVSELLVMTGIRFMRRLENQNLAIATNEQGILLVSPQGEIVQRIDQLRGLESQTVHHLIEDQEYGLRAGTDFGVSRIDLQTPYTLFFRRDGLELSLIHI